MKELSPAQRCKKNKWKKGTVLRATYDECGYTENHPVYFKITAIGECSVLGKQVSLPPLTTTGEEILPLNDSSYSNWRKVSG